MYEQIELWPELRAREDEFEWWVLWEYGVDKWIDDAERAAAFSQFLAKRNARMQGEPKEPI